MLNPVLKFFYLHIKHLFNRKPLYTEFSQNSPVFIISAGRSGSTLLRKILLRTGLINIPPETNSMLPVLIINYIKYNDFSWDKIIDKLVQLVKEEPCLKFWSLELSQEDIRFLKYSIKDKSLHGIIEYIYGKYGKQYSPNALVWGDKTPMMIFYIDIIVKVFPKAKFIFLIRDGRDVISSFITNNIYTDILYLSKRWIESIKSGKKLKRILGSRQVLWIKYEEMVLIPEKSIGKICEFIGIDYSNAFLKNTDVYMGDDILNHHRNTQNEINARNIGKWKKELTEKQKKEIAKLINKQIQEMGYM